MPIVASSVDPGALRRRNAELRAPIGRASLWVVYNKANGNEVGAVWMPAPQSGTPMTYLADGKQYIIVPVSGANYSGEFLAYRLPD